MNLWVFGLSVALASTLAAFVTVGTRGGYLPFWATICASIVPATVWSLNVKWGTRSLLVSSFIYDIVANLVWTGVLLYNGDVLNIKQWCGVALFIIAIFLIG